MPDRRILQPVLALCAVLLLHSRAATGQTVAEAKARAERLLQEFQVRMREKGRVDSLVQSRLRSDTVRVGALSVVAPRANVPAARRAAEVAWPVLAARYGPLASTLGKHMILIEPADSAGRQYSARARLPDGSFTSQAVGSREEELAAGLRRFADLLLWANADSTLRAWYPATPDAGIDSAITAERIYLELVTSPAVPARSCLIGDDNACGEALGLRPVTDPLTSWYDPAGRRALARRIAPMLDRPPYQVQYLDCVEEGSDPSCLAVLRAAMGLAPGGTGQRDLSEGVFRVPDPVGDDPRRALVAQVVRLGGPESWSRLIGSVGQPLEQRLALAAQVPADSLMRVWRRELLAARPRPVSVGSGTLLVALLWACAGLLFAIGASRWH